MGNLSEQSNQNKQLTWASLGITTFTVVWGFQNVFSGYHYFEGTKSIFVWIGIMALYFLPYALMVGELGAVFKNESGGVSSWIGRTISPKAAFIVAWIYWAIETPYLSQKPSKIIVDFGWVFFGEDVLGKAIGYDILKLQAIGIAIFLIGVWISRKGLKVLSIVSSLAGTFMFVLSMMFVLVVFVAPAITGRSLFDVIPHSWEDFTNMYSLPKPEGFQTYERLAALVLGVGGCELISPYAKQMKDKKRGFSKGILLAAFMVTLCAIVSTLAVAMLGIKYDTENLISTGGSVAFKALGDYLFGNGTVLSTLLPRMYAFVEMCTQTAVMLICIDAPLRMILNEENKKFLPNFLFKKNSKGHLVNGYRLLVVIVCSLIAIPTLLNFDKMVEVEKGVFKPMTYARVIKDVFNLIATTMPLSFLAVFVAYVLVKRQKEKFPSEYVFIKNKSLAQIVGWWCFALTLIASIWGMFESEIYMKKGEILPLADWNWGKLAMNVCVPIVLIGLGFVLPKLKPVFDGIIEKDAGKNEV